MRNKHKEQCIKNKHLSLIIFIYSVATLYCKVCLMSTKAGQFSWSIYKTYKIMEEYVK